MQDVHRNRADKLKNTAVFALESWLLTIDRFESQYNESHYNEPLSAFDSEHTACEQSPIASIKLRARCPW